VSMAGAWDAGTEIQSAISTGIACAGATSRGRPVGGDQSGSGCLYTINTSVARVTMSASMSGGITTNMEPLLVDMLLTARVEAFTMRYEEGYGPTVDSRRNGRSHAQSVTN